MPDSLGKLAREWVSGRVDRGEVTPATATTQYAQLAGLVQITDTPDEDSLKQWQKSVASKRLSTRLSYLSTVARFCAWLAEEGHIERDPSGVLSKPRTQRRIPRALTRAEVQQIMLRVPDVRWGAIVALLLECGLRCVEVSRLDMCDLDTECWTLFVVGKGGHQRMVPVTPLAQRALDAYLSERDLQPGPLFLATGSHAKKDGRMSAHWISVRVGEIMEKAGVHKPGDGKTAHALRHTCLADLYESCGDLTVVQALAGHRSIATTEVYLRVAGLDRVRAAMESRAPIRGPTIRQAGPLGGAGSPGVNSPDAPDPT